MQDIARALDIPLPLLLEADERSTFDIMGSDLGHNGLPIGFERIAAVLPSHQAFIVKKWSEAARKKCAG